MNIKAQSTTDKIFGCFSKFFKMIGKYLGKISLLKILLVIGIGGWIFGGTIDFITTIKIFGLVFVGAFFSGIFLLDSNNTPKHVIGWFGTWIMISGFAGYYFEGNYNKVTNEITKSVYMVDMKLKDNKIEYIGPDKMTKIIKLENPEIVAHIINFRDSNRFVTVINTKVTKNLILDFIGVDYSFHKKSWISYNDKIANKELFRIK